MYGIEILVKEHENILNFTNILESECEKILDGKEVDVEFFRRGIVFIREYADKHHHQKEEELLFKYMVEELGPVAEKLVKNGMLVEHSLARGTTMSLEEYVNKYEEDPSTYNKLHIIGHAMTYANLLRRHATAENTVAYPFAEKNLKAETLEKVDVETRNIEENTSKDFFEKFKEFMVD